MLSAQSCSWQGTHVFLLEAIPSKKGGVLVTWGLHAVEVSIPRTRGHVGRGLTAKVGRRKSLLTFDPRG